MLSPLLFSYALGAVDLGPVEGGAAPDLAFRREVAALVVDRAGAKGDLRRVDVYATNVNPRRTHGARGGGPLAAVFLM